MGLTVLRYPVRFPTPTRIAAGVRYERVLEISVSGNAPVWLGADDVSAGRGRQLSPGDDPFVTATGDELFAAAWSPSQVTIVEQT
jgi:hypothetical protein